MFVQPGLLPLLRGAGVHLPHTRIHHRHLLANLGGAGSLFQSPHRTHLPGERRPQLWRQPVRAPIVTALKVQIQSAL